MTQNEKPDTQLPTFSVNVAPTSKITSAHLRTLLEQFRQGSIEPLILGDDNQPEAAIIPFSAFVRLMRHDHASHVEAEHAFQGELSRRIQDSDAARARGEEPTAQVESDEDLLAFAESLGEVGRAWADERRAHDREGGTDDQS